MDLLNDEMEEGRRALQVLERQLQEKAYPESISVAVGSSSSGGGD